MLYFAISKIANNIICLMNIDSNPQTKKILNKIAIELFTIADTIDNCEFECSKLDTIKYNISKLIDYIESAPIEIRIMHGGTPYVIKQSIQNIKKIYDIVM
jgi:Co/Zn/Cd efflux system component